MAKTIFRKIGGRIIPIKIGSLKSSTPMGFSKMRTLTASVKKEVIGEMTFGVPIKGIKKSLKIGSLNVNREFQRHGIGTELFKHLKKLGEKSGYSRIKGTQLVSESAAKIRNKFNTDFFRFYQPGNTSKKITFDKALKAIKKGKDVRAITKLRKLKK